VGARRLVKSGVGTPQQKYSPIDCLRCTEQQVRQRQPVGLQAAACLLGCEAGTSPLHAAATLAVRAIAQRLVVRCRVRAAVLQLQGGHTCMVAGFTNAALQLLANVYHGKLAAWAHSMLYCCCTAANHCAAAEAQLLSPECVVSCSTGQLCAAVQQQRHAPSTGSRRARTRRHVRSSRTAAPGTGAGPHPP
jgi:hypothetical protein